MTNPYESPGCLEAPVVSQGSRSTQRSVFAAALISGLCIYIPILGIRGALVCMFPGIANRSFKLIAKGMGAGLVADFAFNIAWMMLGMIWEPRWSYNRLLASLFPPQHMVVTHCGCIVPNSVQFVLGLAGWCGVMFAIWLYLWPQRFSHEVRLVLLSIGIFAVAVSGVILWVISPMDDWWSHGAQPFGDITSDWYYVILIGAMPASYIVVGTAIYIANSWR